MRHSFICFVKFVLRYRCRRQQTAWHIPITWNCLILLLSVNLSDNWGNLERSHKNATFWCYWRHIQPYLEDDAWTPETVALHNTFHIAKTFNFNSQHKLNLGLSHILVNNFFNFYVRQTDENLVKSTLLQHGCDTGGINMNIINNHFPVHPEG